MPPAPAGGHGSPGRAFAAGVGSPRQSYPIAAYPRFLIWLLPGCVILMTYALEPLIQKFAHPLDFDLRRRPFRYAVVSVCAGAVLAMDPRPNEQNRDAIRFLQAKLQASNCLFVHGGLSAHHYYYRRLGWSPDCVYLGNTDWPCCALNRETRVVNPTAHTLADDLADVVGRVRGRRLWLLMPAGRTGHWSGVPRAILSAVPDTMRALGCRQDITEPFDLTLVMRFDCR